MRPGRRSAVAAMKKADQTRQERFNRDTHRIVELHVTFLPVFDVLNLHLPIPFHFVSN